MRAFILLGFLLFVGVFISNFIQDGKGYSPETKDTIDYIILIVLLLIGFKFRDKSKRA